MAVVCIVSQAVEMKGDELADKLLLQAIKNKDTIAMSEAFNKGANVHARDEKGRSMLFLARANECHDCFAHLLLLGADPDQEGIGEQPLLGAVSGPGAIDYLKSAVEFGVDIDIKTKDYLGNWEPYIFQVIKGDKANMVRYLITNGVKTDVVDAEGRSPLQAAFHSERIQNAYVLLDKEIISPIDRNLGASWFKERLIRSKSRYATPVGEHWIEKVSRELVEHGLISESDLSEIADADAVEQPVRRRLP